MTTAVNVVQSACNRSRHTVMQVSKHMRSIEHSNVTHLKETATLVATRQSWAVSYAFVVFTCSRGLTTVASSFLAVHTIQVAIPVVTQTDRYTLSHWWRGLVTSATAALMLTDGGWLLDHSQSPIRRRYSTSFHQWLTNATIRRRRQL